MFMNNVNTILITTYKMVKIVFVKKGKISTAIRSTAVKKQNKNHRKPPNSLKTNPIPTTQNNIHQHRNQQITGTHTSTIQTIRLAKNKTQNIVKPALLSRKSQCI